MPGGDATGPVGLGPMTGRRAGGCEGFGLRGNLNPIYGYGSRTGYGGRGGYWYRGAGPGRRGWRNVFHATGLPGWRRSAAYGPAYESAAPFRKTDPETEIQGLKEQADALRSELK